jgi:hypothetical protein
MSVTMLLLKTRSASCISIPSAIAVLVNHHQSGVNFLQKSSKSFDRLGVLHAVAAE